MHIKYFLAAAALAAPFATIGEAHASDLYVRGGAGVTTNSEASGITFNDGSAFAVGAGTTAGPFRLEARVDRLSGDLGGYVQAHALDAHLDATLDLQLGHDTAVFGGAGIDYVRAEAKVPWGGVDADGTGWSWHGGVSHRVGEHLIADLEYRELTANSLGPVDLKAREVMVSLRAPF
jgi:opacity protein-like surface antigen